MRRKDTITLFVILTCCLLVALGVAAWAIRRYENQEKKQEVTVQYVPIETVITSEVTREVTRIVEKPVTVIVTDIPTPTLTASPTIYTSPTPTSPPPTPTPTCTPVPTKKPTPKPTKVADSTNHSWKPYTRYTVYNVKSSMQYKLQQIAHTGSLGIRVVKDSAGEERYCVAMAIAWAGGQPKDIGRCIDIHMKNGAVLKCVLSDVKKTEHTAYSGNKYGAKGELVEFIIDQNAVSAKVKNSGDVSNAGPEFVGEASKVVVRDDLYIPGLRDKESQ